MIEFTTTLDCNAFFSFSKFTQRKNIKAFKIVGIIFALFGVLGAIASFEEPIIIEELIYSLAFSFILLFVGLFLIFGYTKQLDTLSKKIFFSNKLYTANPKITYQFNENNLRVLFTSELGIEDSTYSYEIISSIVETSDYIFLLISTNSAHIIPKTPDNTKDIEQVTKFLKTKFIEKYVYYNKK